MVPLLTQILTAAGGLLAGLAVATAICWRQRATLRTVRRDLAAARRDADAARRDAAAARYAADHDALTGLANRRGMHSHLTQALNDGRQIAVAVLDLDRFKLINDTPGLGHIGGDMLLCAVAERLAALPHPVRLAARLGGDEFGLVIDGDLTDAVAAANDALHAVTATPVPVGRWSITVSASIGVAAGWHPSDLLHSADLAMYQAKIAGGGVVRAAAPGQVDGAAVPQRPGRRIRDRRHET